MTKIPGGVDSMEMRGQGRGSQSWCNFASWQLYRVGLVFCPCLCLSEAAFLPLCYIFLSSACFPLLTSCFHNLWIHGEETRWCDWHNWLRRRTEQKAHTQAGWGIGAFWVFFFFLMMQFPVMYFRLNSDTFNCIDFCCDANVTLWAFILSDDCILNSWQCLTYSAQWSSALLFVLHSVPWGIVHFRTYTTIVFLKRVRWEDWCHSHTRTVNMKLKPVAG